MWFNLPLMEILNIIFNYGIFLGTFEINNSEMVVNYSIAYHRYFCIIIRLAVFNLCN